jgi:nitrogen fixation protein
MTNNIAFNNILNPSGIPAWSNVGVTSKDGTSVDYSDIMADGTLGGRFTIANGWTVVDGKLPGFGTAVEIPTHLTYRPFGGMKGTVGDPYIITEPEELELLARIVNTPGMDYNDKHFKLDDDIELSDYQTGIGWTPIGNSAANAFKGVFYGNNKVISDLSINSTTLAYAGLFGYLETGSAVKNLGIIEADINTSADIGSVYIGTIAGYSLGTISNCFSTGLVRRTYTASNTRSHYTGGITGYNGAGGTVSNCYSTAVVSCIPTGGGNTSYAGGIAGRNYGSLTDCAALNEKILCTGTGINVYFGRVVGRNESGGTTSNNIAFNNMLNPGDLTVWNNVGATLIDGEDITNTEIHADGTLDGRFTVANGWTVENGKLPGFGTTAVEMPDHLK